MTDEINLEVIGGAPEASDAGSRAAFLERAVVAGGVIVAGGVLLTGLPKLAASAPSADQDAEILNFALIVETLQAKFYEAGLKSAGLSGELRQFAQVVGGHESKHVAFIKQALGKGVKPLPKLSLGDATSSAAKFRAAAVSLEDIGLAAYNGQATNLTPATLAAAAKIVSVEARHASWVRDLAGEVPAPHASDTVLSADETEARLREAGYLG